MNTTLRALIAVNVAAILAFAVALYVAPPLGSATTGAAPPAPIVAAVVVQAATSTAEPTATQPVAPTVSLE